VGDLLFLKPADLRMAFSRNQSDGEGAV
jgi:hypothetical protein